MTRDELISALRQAADLYEKHPDLPAPDEVDLVAYVWNNNADGAEALRAFARALGRTQKDYMDLYVGLQHFLVGNNCQGVKMRVVVKREAVCQRIVKIETIPAKPARVVEIPAEPEKVVEKFEWDCGESILAPAFTSEQEKTLARAAEAAGQDESHPPPSPVLLPRPAAVLKSQAGGGRGT